MGLFRILQKMQPRSSESFFLMITSTSIDFKKAEHDFIFLLLCFQEVLRDLGESELAEHLPWQSASMPLEHYPDVERALQAFSIFFQLLNMAEENSTAQNRRAFEAEHGLSHLNGLWGKTLLRSREYGVSETTISTLLPEVSIEAVLTAHPTEAKRKTVLEQHRQLYLLLVQRENQMWTPQQLDIRNEIKVVMERLWRTGEILYEKPDDLTLLRQSLLDVGAQHIADTQVTPVFRIVQTFGFHLGTLDIRQNSQVHELALSQLMNAASMNGNDFLEWDEAARRAFLDRELQSPRPFTHPDMTAGAEAEAVLSCYRVLLNHSKKYGTGALGSLIVSMTRSVSDLLIVYLFAREVGLMTPTDEGDACILPVVPLFETDILSDKSNQAYRELIGAEGFFTFFREATPIDIIESTRIGSRPARRSGKTSLDDLRAIPRVFSWNQARFSISGWYGVGSALEYLQTSAPKTFEEIRTRSYAWPPIRYIISNADTSLASANLHIMRQYASLVSDIDIRERILGLIEAEYHRTKTVIDLLFAKPLEAQRLNVNKFIALRQEGLDRLHLQQIKLLRQWRELQHSGKKEESEKLLMELFLTVNAISGGLRTTG